MMWFLSIWILFILLAVGATDAHNYEIINATCILSNISGLNAFNEVEFEIPNNDVIIANIIIQNSSTKELPHNLLRTFPRAISVDAQHLGLEHIQTNTFTCGSNKTSHLLSINVAHNRLTTIPGAVFETSLALQRLNLSYNYIETINTAFFGLFHLTTLDLAHNKLRVFDQLNFERLHILEMLNISHNFIASFDQNGAVDHSKLQSLDLSHNRLEKCPNLSKIQTLHSLDVSHNSGMELQSKQCWPDRLQELSLNGVGIDDCWLLPKMEHLLTLSIEDNGMTCFDFCNFPVLKNLSIANNSWECDYLKQMLNDLRTQNISFSTKNSITKSGANMVQGIGCTKRCSTHTVSQSSDALSIAAFMSSGVIIVVYVLIKLTKFALRRWHCTDNVTENCTYIANYGPTSHDVEGIAAEEQQPNNGLEIAGMDSDGYCSIEELGQMRKKAPLVSLSTECPEI